MLLVPSEEGSAVGRSEDQEKHSRVQSAESPSLPPFSKGFSAETRE